MTSQIIGSILLVSFIIYVDGKNLAGPKKVAKIMQNTDRSHYYQGATMRDQRHTNLMLHVIADAGIDADELGLGLTRGDECARVCIKGDLPKLCKFEFMLEHYHSMGPACNNCSGGVTDDCFAKNCITADGIERGVLSINRQIPGPAVQVCKGDVVIVDVRNEMAGVDEAFHWHGVLQHGTPWMDGVPMLTQCPIQSPNMFRYVFVAREAGTKFYHSHSGHNKVNGMYGPLIVREPEEDEPNTLEYECDLEEHHIMLADWLHMLAEMFVPGLQTINNLPKSILLNGRGQYRNPTAKVATDVPLTVYRMHGCKSYRFRLVNACNGVCAMQLQIENHTMTVIASDSGKVRPITVNTLYSSAGERYDFVVHANQPPGNYWIRVKGMGVCESTVAEQFAILSYEDPAIVSDLELSKPTRPFPSPHQPYDLGIHVNKPHALCGQQNSYCLSDLMDASPTTASKAELIASEPDHQFVLRFNNYAVPKDLIYNREFYHHYTNFGAGKNNVVGAVQNITFAFPTFPPLTQPEEIIERSDNENAATWCDEFNFPHYCDEYPKCPCPHRLVVEQNKIVELILVDETKSPIFLTHPFHLHGHDFYVLDIAPLPPYIASNPGRVAEIAQNGEFDQVFSQQRKAGQTVLNAPLKDTVQVPSSGLVRLRFNSTNAGFWFMHCHIDWHLSIGMAFTIQVGNIEDMAPTPLRFPTCYDYAPDIELRIS